MTDGPCKCGSHHDAGRWFYVSVVDAGRRGLLAGPFDNHAAALDLVDAARALAIAKNPWAHFYAFGTVGVSDPDSRRGVFNAELGVTV